jgi:7-cyano-7-deazaguanine reductase
MFYNTSTNLTTAVKEKLIPELELLENPLKNSGVIRITFPEFTCVCPKTGYPDFGTIQLFYEPDACIVELKSWKLFLNSFRMVGTYHEAVTDFIFTTVKETIAPKWALLLGDFFPRGNVDTSVVLETPTPRPVSASTLFSDTTPHSTGFHS